MNRIRTVFIACLLASSPAGATWSVIAVDSASSVVVIASATCVPQERFATFPATGSKDIRAIVVPGVGVAAAQASVDRTRANQKLIFSDSSACFRSACSEDLATRAACGPLLVEPVGFVMDRRMLQGVKERAERHDPVQRGSSHVE